MKSEKMRTWYQAMTSGALDSFDNYMGSREHADCFMFLGQSRDSDALERSNFEKGLELLGGESEAVQIHRFGHWACGWIEEIMVIPDTWIDEEWRSGGLMHNWYLVEADKITADLEDYPVIDEEHYCELEYDEACECWENMGIEERMEICRNAGISVFSARRDYLPEDDCGYIADYLRS